MSIVASEIINRAKAIWREAAADNILSSANCLLFLSDGLIELRSVRPDVKFDSDLGYVEHSDVTATSSVISLDAKFRPCLVDYLVGRGFQADANLENHENRANRHMADFVAKAKGA